MYFWFDRHRSSGRVDDYLFASRRIRRCLSRQSGGLRIGRERGMRRLNSFKVSHFDSVEGVNWSFRRRVVESVGVDRGVRIKKLYLVGLEFFFFGRDVRFVPLGFVFFGDSFNRNSTGRNDGIGGAGRGCRRRRRSGRRGNRKREEGRR